MKGYDEFLTGMNIAGDLVIVIMFSYKFDYQLFGEV